MKLATMIQFEYREIEQRHNAETGGQALRSSTPCGTVTSSEAKHRQGRRQLGWANGAEDLRIEQSRADQRREGGDGQQTTKRLLQMTPETDDDDGPTQETAEDAISREQLRVFFLGIKSFASYHPHTGSNLTHIATLFKSRFVTRPQDIANYNKNGKDYTRVNVPFPCECINGEFLGYKFQYSVSSGDTYESIAKKNFSNLVTAEWLRSFNSYSIYEIPETGTVNVTVNCSCGDRYVSKDYGLFITYPLRPEDPLESIANQTKLDPLLLLRYSPGVNFSQGSCLVYVPGKDVNGNYVPFYPRYFVLFLFNLTLSMLFEQEDE
ncbi:chitin elicitor receptor kinase 1-like [Arachis ipaensis]|uniref:chitin elicitor receptor kinase 1-like n=1 Tax=Arachis ipaensis TaxID=130454 RepID=UPI000A2B6011|nr:chitin elicitor receptor kinase 1-like [Arachis ipaensis]